MSLAISRSAFANTTQRHTFGTEREAMMNALAIGSMRLGPDGPNQVELFNMDLDNYDAATSTPDTCAASRLFQQFFETFQFKTEQVNENQLGKELKHLVNNEFNIVDDVFYHKFYDHMLDFLCTGVGAVPLKTP